MTGKARMAAADAANANFLNKALSSTSPALQAVVKP